MSKHWQAMLKMHDLNRDQFKELSPVTKGRCWVRYYESLGSRGA